MVLLKVLERGLGVISTVILARLLLPADFGIVAMATSIVFLLELINDFGFEVAIIQKPNATRQDFDTAWTLRLILTGAGAILLVLLSGPAADFYEQPNLQLMILLLGAGSFVESLQNIGIVEFQKELRFNKEFLLRLTVKLVTFALTVPLALLLRNYWALVAGMVGGRVTTVILSYVMHSHRPRLTLASWRALLGFSSWLFIGNVFFFLRMRAADLIIGKMAGAGPLGLFSVSQEIAELAKSQLVMPINRAAFAGYSKVSSDQEDLRRRFLDVLGVASLIAFPTGLGLAAASELFIPVFLGPNWLGSIELIQILAFNTVLAAIQVNISSVYFALGRAKLSACIGMIFVGILIPLLLYLTGRFGVAGAAWGYLVSSLCVAPIHYGLMLRLLNLRVPAFISVVWRPIVAATLMYMLVRLFVEALPRTSVGIVTQLGMLLGAVFLGVAAYVAASAVLWIMAGRPAGAERHVTGLIARKIVAPLGARLRPAL